MRKYVISAAMALSLATPVFAADMAVKAPPAPPPMPLFSWTGFYVGANIGGAWANDGWHDTLFLTNFTGVVIPGVGNIVVNNNDRWITTVAARFGWAIDHWLLYGKAGGGWVGSNSLTITNLNTGLQVTCGSFNGFGNSCSNSTGGWLLGAGFEYAFTNNWTVKLEYDYLGLGSRTFTVPVGSPFLVGDTFTTNNRNVQMVKVGVNYLFNWGAPVAARY